MIDQTSQQILELRARAGNPCTTCPLCGRAPETPYRRIGVNGSIVEGCVDAAHTYHLTNPADIAWHTRPAADLLRRGSLNGLRRLLTGPTSL